MRSPVFGQLESSLAHYLADVSHRAQYGDEHLAAALARMEVPRLVEALKAVLDEHEPDQFGRCPSCRTSRFGRTPAPCRAYLTAHLCLIDTEDEPAAVEVTAPMRRPVILAERPGFGMLNAPG